MQWDYDKDRAAGAVRIFLNGCRCLNVYAADDGRAAGDDPMRPTTAQGRVLVALLTPGERPGPLCACKTRFNPATGVRMWRPPEDPETGERGPDLVLPAGVVAKGNILAVWLFGTVDIVYGFDPTRPGIPAVWEEANETSVLAGVPVMAFAV